MEEWFSGVLPYPELLSSQLLIILLYGKICLDFAKGHGYFTTPRRRLGTNLLKVGSLYLGVMIIRYVIRMSLYSHERWTGGSIPIFFHWVLSTFLLVLGTYHWVRTRDSVQTCSCQSMRQTRILQWAQVILVGLGVVLWVGYQLAPSILANELRLARAQFAVRVQDHAIMTTIDGTKLVAEVYHPQHIALTPTILVRIPPSSSFKNSLLASTIGRMWAERGYTVVTLGTRGMIETTAWISKQPWFNGKIATWEDSLLDIPDGP